MGLRAALGLIEQEGLSQVLARHRRFALAVHAAVEVWSESGHLGFVCQPPQARSVSVTSIAVKGVDPEDIRRVAREQFNVSLAGGLGPFMGRAFRIGHLGDLSPGMLLGCLGAVQGTLDVLHVPVGRGALDAALEVLCV